MHEYAAGTAPFQDQVHVRALVFDFLSSHASMLDGWAERTSKAVSSWERTTPEKRDQTARATIARIRDAYPEPS